MRVPASVTIGNSATEFRRVVIEAKGWARAGMAFAAGLVSVLAFAPFFLSPILLVTLPVFVWLIDGASPTESRADRRAMRAAAAAGWWFGFGFFFGGLFWIGEAFLVEKEKFGWALPFAVTLMPAGLALFWSAASGGARYFWRPGVARLLVLAVALALAEWTRGHVLTGFPWNVLGYSLTYPLALMQGAAVLGIYGLTLWSVVIFSAPLVMAADAAPEQRKQGLLTGLAIAAVPLAALLAYGSLKLWAAPSSPMVEGVRIRIVQPSVPQREKWQPENQGPIFREHLDLSRQDATGKRDDLQGVTHVIWPEAAMPFLPLEHPEALAAIAELLPEGTHLLSGALRRERAPEAGAEPGAQKIRAYNSLMVFDHGGDVTATYDKIHLVPFGEYLPFQGMLEAMGFEQLTRIRGGFTPGAAPRTLLDAGVLRGVAGLICYEGIFPAEVAGSDSRPEILINVTNDGWFGDTTGPRQHFHQARVRAVEQGLGLLRAANNGISAVVDAEGRVLHSLALNEKGVIDSGLPAPEPPTIYARFGDWIFACNTFVLVALIVVLARRQRA